MEIFNKNIWSQACTGMITDECDELKVSYSCLTGFKSNVQRPKFFGFIRTVDLEEGDYQDENINLGLGFLDGLSSKDVLYVNGSKSFAYFGELMTRFSSQRKISGVVIDGATRDNNYTLNKDLNILYKSKTPVDIKGRGRVKDVDVPLVLDGKTIQPNDFIFADLDGAVVISASDLSVVERAVEKVIDKEKRIINDIEDNVSIFEIIKNFKSF